ncbi:MAG: triose-phosphate isomerase family protein [Patescibacteria group bacterium]
MARKLFALNWKMNPERLADAEALFTATKRISHITTGVGFVVCPPTIFLSALRKKYDGNVLLGAQDVYPETKGAHTGSISPYMLSSLNVKYVIVGHSERRSDGETDYVVATKVNAVLDARMSPILCVGEAARDDAGNHFAMLEAQLRASLKGVSKAKAKQLVIAYEPLWAIGKTYKQSINAHTLQETVLFIRKILTKIFGRAAGMSVPVLYGGSVEKENAGDLLRNGSVSGFLIGHASLDPDHLRALVRALVRAL